MNKNVGTIDKVFRIILGAGLISTVFLGPQTPWGWVGLVPILTVFISICPIYSIIGLSTIKKSS